jgi:hypothetical protein
LIPNNLLSRYRQYLMDAYGGRAHSLGWKVSPGETDDARLLRPLVLRVIAKQAEDPEAIAEANRLAAAWLDDHNSVAPDMVEAVLVIAARHGDRDLFDRMRAAAKREKDEDFRGTLLECLGFFPDPAILKVAMLSCSRTNSTAASPWQFFTARRGSRRHVILRTTLSKRTGTP